ncbi:MAG TPA: glycosyltransferase family 4 protein [Frankiaceae bacterium]|jgi:phosphatidylinositol alpha-mannosyltransferase|nr:glycosyltransferase family 4 protein [Frankiaceae bacterium]
MRIMLTATYGWPEVYRGGERYLHELAGFLQEGGHDVRIVISGPGPSRDVVRGVAVYRLRPREFSRFGELGREVAFGAAALATVGWRQLDVWHATSTADAAAAAQLGRIRDVRTVFTDHGFPLAGSRERRSDYRLYRMVVRHIDSYVCVSGAAADCLANVFQRTATVVHPGVDTALFQPTRRSEVPTLVYAGSLTEERKGLPLLASAVRRLRETIPALRLEVYGQGEPAAEVAAVADVCEAVDPAHLAERYAGAWATVLPSKAEPFGMVLTESLAAGTPVVALREGSGPSDIVRPGVGLLAGDTADDLAAACRGALDLARHPATAAACRQRAMAFDWRTAIVPQLEEVYAGG